jgi:hypothetical protein
MRIVRISLATVVSLLVLPSLCAQEKPKENPSEEQPLNFARAEARVVLTELDGAKVVSSLPYVVPLQLNERAGNRGYVRIGMRIPFSTGSKSGEQSLTYNDVGTSIDCSLEQRGGHLLVDQNQGKYILSLSIEKSSLYVSTRDPEGRVQGGKEWEPGQPPPGIEPVVREFRGSFEIPVTEGKPTEVAVATDPITGHVLKAEVTLTVTK